MKNQKKIPTKATKSNENWFEKLKTLVYKLQYKRS